MYTIFTYACSSLQAVFKSATVRVLARPSASQFVSGNVWTSYLIGVQIRYVRYVVVVLALFISVHFLNFEIAHIPNCFCFFFVFVTFLFFFLLQMIYFSYLISSLLTCFLLYYFWPYFYFLLLFSVYT